MIDTNPFYAIVDFRQLTSGPRRSVQMSVLTPADMRRRAALCRRQAEVTFNRADRMVMLELAGDYERQARMIELP